MLPPLPAAFAGRAGAFFIFESLYCNSGTRGRQVISKSCMAQKLRGCKQKYPLIVSGLSPGTGSGPRRLSPDRGNSQSEIFLQMGCNGELFVVR